MSKRKNYSPEFKAKVALEALKVAELAGQFGAPPTMIHSWKRALLEGASGVFARAGRKPQEIDEEQVKELHAKIGGWPLSKIFCHECSNRGSASEAENDCVCQYESAHWQAVQAAVDLAVVVLLSTQRRNDFEPDADASDRRTVPGNVVLRCAADDLASARRGPLGARKADQAVDEDDGAHADLPEAQHQQGSEGTQNLPIFATWSGGDGLPDLTGPV